MRTVWMFLAFALGASVLAAEPEPQLELLGTLEGGRPSAYASIAFSPDGKTLASGEYNREDGASVVKLWDVNKRKVIASLRGHTNAVTSVAFSRDGKTLVSSGDGKEVKLWDVVTGKEKATLKGAPKWMFLALSSDGKTIAFAKDNHAVVLWDVATGKAKASKEKASLKGFSGLGRFVAISPDGTLYGVGGGKFSTIGLPGAGEVKLWEVATGRERACLKGHVKLKVSLDDLSYLHKAEGVPKRVLLKVAALNGMEFQSEEDTEGQLTKALEKALDKDQRKKYLGPIQRQIGTTYYDGPEVVWSVAFSPDGKALASASLLGTVLLWDVQTGKRTARLQRFNPNGREKDVNPAYTVAFSPDGKILAVGTWRGIKLWDVESGENVVPLSRPSATVWSVAFSPDGKTLASAGSKGVIGPRDRREGDPTLRMWKLVPPKKADK